MSMSYREWASVYAAAAMIAGMGAWPVPVAGQAPAATKAAPAVQQPAQATAWTAPRMPWGDPDLQGIWITTHFGGMGGSAVPLERPQEHAGKFELTAEERDSRVNAGNAREEAFTGSGNRPFGRSVGTEWYDTYVLAELGIEISRRTSMIVDPPDGRLPPLTAAAQQRRVAELEAARHPQPFRRLQDLSAGTRCLTSGFPNANHSLVINTGKQIIQAPGYVTILYEMKHEARVIPVDERPSSTIPQWWGQPRGHWEGTTLVVETTHFNGKSDYQGAREHLRVVERFTRVSEREIDYRYTIDDPTTFTRPWTVAINWLKDPRQFELVEYACHEGNYALPGIVKAAQMEAEKAAAETKKAR